jgi:hypothetical protein
MTLIIQRPTGAKLVLRKELPADAEADAYIAAVEAADGQALEPGVKFAIKNFVLCCKDDGIWAAIKASCILAGARTLTGALVPLVGTAPTNNNFVSGDYNRETGLIGDGSTKYLNSNRASNADPQNNIHQACFVSNLPTVNAVFMGVGTTEANSTNMFSTGHRNRSSTVQAWTASTGLIATSRTSSSSYSARNNQATTSHTISSNAADSFAHFIFARNNSGSVNQPTNCRLAFYSIGESLDLALLDARVTDLINAFAAAIP